MAAIYQADVWCDGCAEEIKNRLFAEDPKKSTYDNRREWESDKGYDDERLYDSDDYPKYCIDYEESDTPEHCAAGSGCVNAEDVAGFGKVGYFFGNDLTEEGEEYVKEAVRDGGPVAELWKEFYDYLDYLDDDDDDDDDEYVNYDGVEGCSGGGYDLPFTD